MKKAYYLISVMKLLSERHQRTYIPGEPFDLKKEVHACFLSIQNTGYITPAHGLSCLTDDLVGKKKDIILSIGKCHQRGEPIPKELTFGFIFNAQVLIKQGAFLSIENLDADYDRITQEVINRIVSTLPQRPEISNELLDKFMKASKSGDHSILREYFKQRSTDPQPDLMRALEKKDIEFPGCRQAMEEIQQGVKVVNAQKLLKGNAALEYLKNAPEDGSCELLVWKQLSVAQAIGTVQQGKPCINENCQNLNSLEELEDEKSILYH